MLPSAKKSLQDGGFSPKVSAWILIGGFLGGAIVIQLVSRILHHHMPTHVVDCEHTHEEDDEENRKEANDHDHDHDHEHDHDHSHAHHDDDEEQSPEHHDNTIRPTDRPQISTGSTNTAAKSYRSTDQRASTAPPSDTEDEHLAAPTAARRPTLQSRISQKLSNITNKKTSCDCNGPCYGFTEPCGTDCFKKIQSRGSFRTPSTRSLRKGTSRSIPTLREHAVETTPLLQENRAGVSAQARADSISQGDTTMPAPPNVIVEEDESGMSKSPTIVENDSSNPSGSKTAVSNGPDDEENGAHHHGAGDATHHHHVPTNAFLSIGLQTSIAIALHKLPEGFITYATNHANPELGFAVFLALFIHNITEGFALALPLYLAIGSRPKAMFWSFILGGCSQPLGAGVAAIWFKIAGDGELAPGEGAYGAMFAVTAGIMASVALQLFSESLDLTHNRGLCMIFAFIGMGILGVSSALTA